MKKIFVALCITIGICAADYSDASAQRRYKVKKRGWSRKAKGATAGGVGGAALGAAVGGGKGAIIGGATGAAGGYLYGRRRDRRKGDNRATVIKRR